MFFHRCQQQTFVLHGWWLGTLIQHLDMNIDPDSLKRCMHDATLIDFDREETYQNYLTRKPINLLNKISWQWLHRRSNFL